MVSSVAESSYAGGAKGGGARWPKFMTFFTFVVGITSSEATAQALSVSVNGSGVLIDNVMPSHN